MSGSSAWPVSQWSLGGSQVHFEFMNRRVQCKGCMLNSNELQLLAASGCQQPLPPDGESVLLTCSLHCGTRNSMYCISSCQKDAGNLANRGAASSIRQAVAWLS